MDVIKCAEFCCSRLMGFDSVRGQNSPSPIDLAGRPINIARQLMAKNLAKYFTSNLIVI